MNEEASNHYDLGHADHLGREVDAITTDTEAAKASGDELDGATDE